MKIAVTAEQDSLKSTIDMRFGRCPYYIIFETENKKIKGHEIVKNTAGNQMRGAGITAAQFVANKNVEVIITGNIGPKAYDILSSTGIKIVTGASGNVKVAVEKYLKGELISNDQPNPGHGRGRGGKWNR
ncbi:MAG: dinitrogenase iron-molybdenum cofactor biosynthesis protein [Candidatus Aenigmarchaeota archaeon]|nr:dinitrogenase iron-molybdenum cofactor biosynthesis protein [Candidatus Aenigmarchaeota archaeon]